MGGKLSRPVYLDPHQAEYQSKIISLSRLILIYLIVDVSIINIIQVKFSCFLLSHCSVCLVAGVGGKLSRPVYLDPHQPEYQSKIISLRRLILIYLIVDVSIINIIQVKFSCFLLSHCSVCLVAVVGGKLSRPVYLAPHLPGYQSKIILLSLLILNY